MVVPVSVLGAFCACVKIPPFQQQDAAVGDGGTDAMTDANGDMAAVTVEAEGNDYLVTAPGYTMRFSSAGSRFPYQLVVGGQHLMGGSQQCGDEQAMGIALYPVQRINGADSTGMGTPTVTVPLAGPWVGQVRIAWNTSYPCSTTTGSLTGHSTFSFFPDGRLTRFDVIENEAAKNASDCTACFGGAGSTFVLTSYTTMIVDSGAFLSDGNEPTLDTYGEEVTNPGSTACVRERQQSVAFSWVNTQNRLRVVDDAPARTIAFVKDIYNGATLPMSSWAATTQMGISASESCGTLEQRIQPFSDTDHELVINSNSVGAALTDGIFGGDPRADGYPVDFPVTITAAQTISPRMPAGFAVWLYSNPIPTNFTVTHSAGHTGTWYRAQRVGSTQLVLWFDVSLEQGETITITES